MTFAGIMWSVFARGDTSHESNPMTHVVRAGAIGFPIALVGVLVGIFTEYDSASDTIFFLGWGVGVLVVVRALLVMLRNK